VLQRGGASHPLVWLPAELVCCILRRTISLRGPYNLRSICIDLTCKAVCGFSCHSCGCLCWCNRPRLGEVTLVCCCCCCSSLLQSCQTVATNVIQRHTFKRALQSPKLLCWCTSLSLRNSFRANSNEMARCAKSDADLSYIERWLVPHACMRQETLRFWLARCSYVPCWPLSATHLTSTHNGVRLSACCKHACQKQAFPDAAGQPLAFGAPAACAYTVWGRNGELPDPLHSNSLIRTVKGLQHRGASAAETSSKRPYLNFL